MLAVALVILGLIGGGVLFYRNQEGSLRREFEADLHVIARLKGDEVVRWRSGLRAQASEVMGSPFFIEGVAKWLAEPGPATAEKLNAQFRSMQDSYQHYDVLLVDPGGQVLISLSGYSGPLHEEAAQALASAFRERRALLTDLHAGPGDLPPHIDAIAPLFMGGGTAPVAIGALVLRYDAERFLFPLVRTWPRPSRSGETLLVRREGDFVLYLNELRHQKDTALTLRVPLSRKEHPAVRSVLGGEGLFDGRDDRGVEVLAVHFPVSDSPWFVIAKMDKTEALAAWRARSVLILSLILGLAAAVISMAAVVWQRNKKVMYQALYRSEAALRKSEERYRTTLDNMIEGCQIIGFDWRYLYVNDAAARHGRRSRDELVGRTMMEAYPGIEKTEMFAALKQCMEGRLCRQMENEFFFPDGTTAWFQLDFDPVPEGVFIMSLDITERKRAEEALRRSEEKYRILHDYAGEAIFAYDTDLKLIEINQTACDLVGNTKDELLGRDVFELAILHPEDTERAQRGIARILEGEKSVVQKIRFRLKDGGYAIFIVTSTPVLKDGNIVAITNICRDITEEERLLAALETSERRFRALFESGMDAMFVYRVKEDDTPSSFLEVNTVACEKLGYSREELLKLTPMDIRAPEDPLTTEEVVRSLSLYRAKLFERLLITKDGQRIPMEVNARLFELNGVPTVIAIARDITQRKKDEEQLRAALKEREVMLREIHHRVKNNIQIISSLLRLQSQSIRDEKTLEIFRESQSRIRSMALIHEKLYQSQDFSRIDFADYIEKMVIHLYTLYKVEAHRIRLKVEAKDVQLDINRAIPCGLIINELVTNALKHAFPGAQSGELLIAMSREKDGKYRLIVRDTGVGLPEAFDLSQSKTLGFQIISDLVKQLDGTLNFKRNGGTEFVITC